MSTIQNGCTEVSSWTSLLLFRSVLPFDLLKKNTKKTGGHYWSFKAVIKGVLLH